MRPLDPAGRPFLILSSRQRGHSMPLLRQVDGLEPNTWTVDYLQEGPEAWTLRLTRAES